MSAIDAIVRVLRREGGEPGNSLHSWRCEYPEQYGECDCLEQIAAEIRDEIAEDPDDGVPPPGACESVSHAALRLDLLAANATIATLRAQLSDRHVCVFVEGRDRCSTCGVAR